MKAKIFFSVALFLSTYFIESMEQQDNVKLESSDEQQFQVPINIVEKSETIKDLVKELAEIVAPTESIYLPNVSGEVLGFILDLLREDLKNKELISGKIDQKIKELYESNPIFGYQFLAAVNYLNISDLLPVAITSVGQLMKTQIKEGKKDALKFGLELIPHNLENQIKEIVVNENIVSLLNKFVSFKILNHTSNITSVTFSPDSKFALTGSSDKTAKLWNVNSGDLIRTFTGHNSNVTSVSFSHDNKILTGSDDKTAKLWDINTGNLLRTFLGHNGNITSVAFSPDSKFALTGSSDKTAKLWNVNSGDLIRTFTGHNSNVTSVSFSHDGKILTGSDDKTAKLWDINTGDLLRTFLGHNGNITSVAFNSDGKYIITGSNDTTAKLWDAKTGNLIQTFTGHNSNITSVAFSSDGKYIITGSGDNTAKLWDANTGNIIRTFFTIFMDWPSFYGYGTCNYDYSTYIRYGNVTSVSFSPDKKYIITGSSKNMARIWDISVLKYNLKSIIFVLLFKALKKQERVKALFEDPYWHNIYLESKRIFVKEEQQDNITVESSDEQQFQVPRNIVEKSITAKNLIEDVDTQCTIPLPNISSEVLKFILDLLNKDLENPEISEEIKTKFFSNLVFGYQFLVAINYLDIPDLLSVGINSLGELIANQIKEGKKDALKFGLELIPHNLENQIRRMIINKNLSLLDKYISFRVLNHSESVYSVAFRQDGKYILTGSYDKTAKLWDVNGNLIHTFTGHTGSINSVAFSPDGKYILTGAEWDRAAKLWDLRTGEIRNFTDHGKTITSVALSPNGKYILTGSYDNPAKLKLWDVKGNLIRIFTDYNYIPPLTSIAFSPNGKYIITGSIDKTPRLWDVNTGNLIRTFTGHTNDVYSVAFSLDGRYVLTGSYDNTAKLWDANSGDLIRIFIKHTSRVTSVAFSPDVRYIITGSWDNTVKLWDTNSGDLIRTFTGHTSSINSVSFSQDGKYILTGSSDNTARLWDISVLALNLKTIVFILLIESLKSKEELKGLFADSYWKDICMSLPDSIQQKLKKYLKCGLI